MKKCRLYLSSICIVMIQNAANAQVTTIQGIRILDSLTLYDFLHKRADSEPFLLQDSAQGWILDKKTKMVFDSVRNKGADTILLYTNEYITANGYSKIIWKADHVINQVELFYINLDSLSGLIAEEYSILPGNGFFDIVSTDYLNSISPVQKFPQDVPFSHDPTHYLFIILGNREYSFHVFDFICKTNQSPYLSQLIGHLAISSNELFAKLHILAKKYK